MFATPILLIIFNRPEATRQVVARLRELKPRYLYVAADAPRTHKEGEEDLCRQTRAIATDIDWDCEVKTLFQEENLGCMIGVSTAITWFFSQVEAGIILEDDCVADLSFFDYCQTLLERYRDDPRVMVISGNNFQKGKRFGRSSYYFSHYPLFWGWATWRRAWVTFDVYMHNLPAFYTANKLNDVLPDEIERMYWKNIFDAMYSGRRRDTWDYQMIFNIWNQGGLTIVPQVNLVTNIGFGLDATHTNPYFQHLWQLPAHSLTITTHPELYETYPKADRRTFRYYFKVPPSFSERINHFLRHITPQWIRATYQKIKNTTE